jgi:radical SAM superfamily enzyme YgiQ (UPF0313 family)
MTLEAIKEAIEHLPEDERRKLADWIDEREDAVWDEQIQRDFSSGGRGEELLEEIRQEAAEGKAQPLTEGLATRRKSRS